MPAVLSGHTHGGQVVIPGVGALARRRFPVLAGLGSHASNTSIFVSRGIGTVYVPVRINCPPEVAHRHADSGGSADLSEPPAVDRPAPVQHEPDRLRIGAMLLYEDPRRQRLRRVVLEHRHGALQDDRTRVELRRHEMHGDAADL